LARHAERLMSARPADKCHIPPSFWQDMKRAGIPPEMLLRQARLPATLHLNAQACVTTAQYFELWKAIELLLPEPGLGIRLIEALDTAANPPWILIAYHGRDYRDGLIRLARFKQLCAPEQLLCDEQDGECVITLQWPYSNDRAPAMVTDVTFATMAELGRRGTGHRIIPTRVELARPAPETCVFQAYFECPIAYDAPADALVLKSTDLDRPFRGHISELLRLRPPALASALEEIHALQTIGEQVKIVLKRSLASGRPELSQLARDLGMSDRTLQRRITEEGTTFRILLTHARQELARQLLSADDANLEAVAYLLGYQDVNAFHRAFKDWEGVTPGRWRERRGTSLDPTHA
jgi:AraC-like DNA-binding protein